MTHSGTDRHQVAEHHRRPRPSGHRRPRSRQDRLRRPDAFVDALQEAFAVADGERVLAALEAHGDAEDYLARAEATFTGRSPAQAPPRPDVSRDASAARRAAGVALAPGDRSHRHQSPSDNGYLTVQSRRGRTAARRRRGRGVAERCSAEHLQQAVLQAIRLGTEIRS